ncbi:arylformamidase [Flavobacterium sp. 270]|uniref:alpha/beta hydrolase n=1 Tax=Flavobacterium sp. 270 TaxID=2512114 RepID=UPI0010668358|nr:alpha/beta hydrolase [Flavobacterium sp. 270]TDW51855.1 arylformamidase [Flavobacterium sp. 270]
MEKYHQVSKGINFPNNNFYGKYVTQEQLDADYDVEKAVSDFPDYIKEYTRNSEEARRILKNKTVIAYGPTLMERLTVYPAKESGAPVFIFIHGGYWKIGLGDDYDFVAMGASNANFTVVIVNYELAPKVNIPEMVRQIRSSIGWTSQNISKFNGDPERIFVGGHSAGGHLAAMTATTNWSDYGLPKNTVKGILAVSGLFDLEPVSRTFVQPAIRITADQILSSSPIRLIVSSKIPLIAAWGAQETEAFITQSSDYLEAWKNAGNKGNALIISEANHFSILREFMTEDGLLTKAVIALENENRTTIL